MPPSKKDMKTKPKYNLRDKQKLKKKPVSSDSESNSESDDYDSYSTSEYETESTLTPPPSTKNKKGKKQVKLDEISDEDENNEEDEEDEDDDSFISNGDEDNDEIDRIELRKCLSSMFPSKYMMKKVKKDQEVVKKQNGKKSNDKKESKGIKEKDNTSKSKEREPKDKEPKSKDREPKDREPKEKETTTKPKHKKEGPSPKKKHAAPKVVVESSNDSEDDSDYTDATDDEGETGKKLNIVFNFGGNADEDDSDDYYTEDDDTEDDEECSSDAEKTFMKENYQEVVVPDDPKQGSQHKDVNETKTSHKPKNQVDEQVETTTADPVPEEETTNIEDEYIELLDLKKQLTEKLKKKPNSKILRNAVEECKHDISELIKTARVKNTKHYRKLIRGKSNGIDEMDYFKKKLSNKEQLTIMKDLKEINSHIYVEKPYRLSILQSTMPAKLKAIAMQKLNVLKSMDPGDSEYHKIKNWVDTFMKIPFGVHKNLSVSMADGLDVCDNFLKNAMTTLDQCVFGLEDAKMQIMQMMGQWITNPNALGTAIAIKGPPGTGKTSLVKDGISKILGREFAFIALGGAGDGSFLEGHSYAYEGSSWGRIVQILIESKCMNPVIYFDELDKISDTPRGQEIIGILTHLTDTTQNCQFHDKYFTELEFDLSKCLFIFSYNDENLVNPILKDRMYRIQTKGYESKEKIVIANNYLLPKIREQVNFNLGDIIIPNDTIQYIVSSLHLTKGEDGVRNLKRCLEIIHTKLNLFRLVKPDNTIFSKQLDIQVSFPFTVERKHVDIFIKNDEKQNQSLLAMYV